MTLAQISSLGRLLTAFLGLFADCFAGTKGRALFRVFVSGLLSDVQRKNVEAIALRMQASVRTLQRFLESIQWNERLLVDRCQQLVAAEQADPEAIGLIDETGVAKSGAHTAGAQRQYNGNPACGERVWSADGGRRKCVISADTHPPSTLNVRNAIASKTHSRGPTSGRFNGTRVGVVLRTDDS